jgi:hypothetical protein
LFQIFTDQTHPASFCICGINAVKRSFAFPLPPIEPKADCFGRIGLYFPFALCLTGSLLGGALGLSLQVLLSVAVGDSVSARPVPGLSAAALLMLSPYELFLERISGDPMVGGVSVEYLLKKSKSFNLI